MVDFFPEKGVEVCLSSLPQ
ncbi:hypothetical protein CEXT_746841, partial [Caerostris extrusa]